MEVGLADPDEVVGCEVGSVPPFGHLKPLKTYLDPNVIEKDRINFNAGKHEVSVDLDPEDLVSCIEVSGAELLITEITQ